MSQTNAKHTQKSIKSLFWNFPSNYMIFISKVLKVNDSVNLFVPVSAGGGSEEEEV